MYADEKARKGKLHSYGVKHHDRNRERNLHKLQDALTNLTYKTSDKLISVTSKSRLLLSLMRDVISTYIIIIFHKKYNAYEILL